MGNQYTPDDILIDLNAKDIGNDIGNDEDDAGTSVTGIALFDCYDSLLVSNILLLRPGGTLTLFGYDVFNALQRRIGSESCFMSRAIKYHVR